MCLGNQSFGSGPVKTRQGDCQGDFQAKAAFGARADANSYASATDGDAYHDGHLYATAWTAATTGTSHASVPSLMKRAGALIEGSTEGRGAAPSYAAPSDGTAAVAAIKHHSGTVGGNARPDTMMDDAAAGTTPSR